MQDVTMLSTAHQAKVIFAIMTRHLKMDERDERGKLDEKAAHAITIIAWGYLESLDGYLTIVGSGMSDAWLARKCKRLHSNFEDDLVIAAAMRAKADDIVTSDERLRRHSPVATITPAQLVTLLDEFGGTAVAADGMDEADGPAAADAPARQGLR